MININKPIGSKKAWLKSWSPVIVTLESYVIHIPHRVWCAPRIMGDVLLTTKKGQNGHKVLCRRGVIQMTRGVRSSIWPGFEPSHGSVTARVEISICWPTTEILATGAKTTFHIHLGIIATFCKIELSILLPIINWSVKGIILCQVRALV